MRLLLFIFFGVSPAFAINDCVATPEFSQHWNVRYLPLIHLFLSWILCFRFGAIKARLKRPIFCYAGILPLLYDLVVATLVVAYAYGLWTYVCLYRANALDKARS